MSDPSSSGIFIGQRRDRLGARLLMMLTCMRLADDFKTDYKINWFPKGHDAPELERPEELFDPKWMEQNFIPETVFSDFEKTARPIWQFTKDKTPDRILNHLQKGKAILVEEGFEIIAFPWEDPKEICNR